MKFPKQYTLKDIASIISTDYVGADDFPVLGMNEIHVVEAGDIVFVDHPKYYNKALESAATVVLINKEVECPEGKALLISDDPFRDFNKLTQYFKPFQPSQSSISPSAKIGTNTVVQPNTFVGNNVVIGDNCIIHSNVSIYDNTIIGDNVTVHSGTVLGANGFYYKKCLIASQTGIAGCVVIEDEVTIWGQVGTASGITIGAKAVVQAQAGVTKSIEGGKVYWGTPIQEARLELKRLASIKQIPRILEELKKLK